MKNVDQNFVIAFGRHVHDIRTSKGLTQVDLSAKTDIPRSLIGRIERGQVNTTIDTSRKIAVALEIQVSELFQF